MFNMLAHLQFCAYWNKLISVTFRRL